jgi:DNA primase catalytic core
MMNDSEIELTHHYSLVDVVQSSGVNLLRDGSVWVGDCPFHDDSNAALLVDPETQHWQCDGVCQTGGTLIEWLMKLHGVSQDDAIEMSRTGQGINCSPQPVSHARTDTSFSSDSEDESLSRQLVDYYHQTIKDNPKALAYLQARKIDHNEVIDHFKLGFSDRTLGQQLPLKNRKEGAAIRGRLQRLGWLKPSGHELMRGSLVIPIIRDGRVRQAYGRKVTDNLRSGTPNHVYLKDNHQGVFNCDALKSSDELIICQSLIDALTFWCAGFRNVTCSFGLSEFDDDLLNALHQFRPKRLLIAFEGTQRGEDAAQMLNQHLSNFEIETYRVELPKGQDVNDYAVNHHNVQQVLGEVIRKAVWLGKEATDSAFIPVDEGESVAEQELVEPDIEDDLPESDINDSEEVTTEELAQDDIFASVVPEPPTTIEFTSNVLELNFNFEDRRYRVRGLENNKVYDQLRINLLVTQDEAIHVDSFDLYSTKHRYAFIKLAALELGVEEAVIKKDLAQLLLQLEIQQQKIINGELEKKSINKELSNKEQKQAMALLTSPNLVEQILADLTQCGLIGEDTNKLMAYLATLSRKLDKPLAVIVQSTSAAGKTALMNNVLSFVPEEDRVQYSALTGQSLFYMGDMNLKHKILAISENEGVSQAAYALRVLQSEGYLSIATTGKDPLTGKHTTHEYKVEGPVTIFSTTTAVDIDEELLNRCLVIQVDEDQQQTKAIHDRQRYEETLEGIVAANKKQDIIAKHQNAQRLIKPLLVVNPYANYLTFTNDKTRTRRDHPKYLTLIRTIALLHQHQREIKTTYLGDKQVPYIEVTLDDITMANETVHDILGHSLIDLPPQTCMLLELIDEMVTGRCKGKLLKRNKVYFTRRDVQEHTGWGMTQIGVHLRRLETMEYLLRHRGKKGQQMVYELLYQKQDLESASKAGLIDMALLNETIKKHQYDGSDTQPNELTATSRTTRKRSIKGSSTDNDEARGLSVDNEMHDGLIAQHHNHTVTYSFDDGAR